MWRFSDIFTDQSSSKIFFSGGGVGEGEYSRAKSSDQIFAGRGDEGTIKERIEQLKETIAETSSDYEREKMEERWAKLSDGVAVLKVGGAPS